LKVLLVDLRQWFAASAPHIRIGIFVWVFLTRALKSLSRGRACHFNAH
jgi:hypothetical protein